MKSRYLDEIRNSFYIVPGDYFVSWRERGGQGPAALIVANTALTRLAPQATLELPEGTTAQRLKFLETNYRQLERNVVVNYGQARDLRVIGEQLLALNDKGLVVDRLSDHEGESIQWLVGLVATIDADK